MMKNEQIITEFERLIKQIEYDIDHAQDKKYRTKHMFRLKQISHALEQLRKFPNEIKKSEQLDGINGIGAGTKKRIDEIIKTGTLSEITYQEKDITYEQEVHALKEVYGVGEKKAYELVTKYNIHSVADLKSAYTSGKIKINNNIAMGLKYYGVYAPQIPRIEMTKMDKYLQNMAKQVNKNLAIKICGSYRRLRPFSNDIDCMLTHTKVITQKDLHKHNYLAKLIDALKDDEFIVDSLTGEDVETKYMGFCRYSKKLPVRRIDIRYIPYESYYPALIYFTGSGAFNQRMRQHAKKLGYKLSEYGLFKKKDKEYKFISVSSEEDVFKKLNYEYLPPEKRL